MADVAWGVGHLKRLNMSELGSSAKFLIGFRFNFYWLLPLEFIVFAVFKLDWLGALKLDWLGALKLDWLGALTDWLTLSDAFVSADYSLVLVYYAVFGFPFMYETVLYSTSSNKFNYLFVCFCLSILSYC